MESTLGIPGGVTDAVPSGTIVMFHGTSIPLGWALCDGSNGTPDLRDQFIVGAGKSYTLCAKGGSASVTLTANQMPSHNHTITGGSHSHTLSGGSHTHSLTSSASGSVTVTGFVGVNGSGYGMCILAGMKNGNDRHSETFSVSGSGGSIDRATPSMTCGNASPSMSASNSGNGQSHENRPPYYALYFIMKL